jgi:hypothetical protein
MIHQESLSALDRRRHCHQKDLKATKNTHASTRFPLTNSIKSKLNPGIAAFHHVTIHEWYNCVKKPMVISALKLRISMLVTEKPAC